MEIFEKDKSSWHSKVNFVDANDVFVGYDTAQDCCEDAGWFISDRIKAYTYDDSHLNNPDFDLDPYVFDAQFFEYVPSSDLDGGGMVAFKLVSDGKPDLYLHLYNCHNGYYEHGFEVKHGGEIVRDDYL